MKSPKLFYGWIIVLACFVSLMVVFGIRLSFQVFFVALTESFGWSRAGTAGIFSVSMLVFALTAPFFGKLLDRWGPQKLFSLGAILFAGGLVASSRATAQWHLYLWYGVAASIGIAIVGLSNYAALVSRWFRRYRGLAVGIAFAGTGAGTFVIVPLTERWISAWGWQNALIGQAALLLAIVLPISLFLLQPRPADMGLQPDGEAMAESFIPPPDMRSRRGSARSKIRGVRHPQMPNGAASEDAGSSNLDLFSKEPSTIQRDWTLEAARSTRVFWLIMLSGWGALFSLRLLTVHQMAVVVDAGIDRFTAAAIMGFSGMITIVAFVAWGAISDRLGRQRTFVFSSVTLILAYILLLFVRGPQNLPLLYVYALMLGLGEGSRSSLVAAVMNDSFPGEAMGQITGYLGAAFGAGAAMGSWSAGILFDWLGSYDVALWLGLGVTALSAGSMAAVGLRGQGSRGAREQGSRGEGEQG